MMNFANRLISIALVAALCIDPITLSAAPISQHFPITLQSNQAIFDQEALQIGLVQAFDVVKQVATRLRRDEGHALAFEHPAMRWSGKGLTEKQHKEIVNQSIAEHFPTGSPTNVTNGWLLDWAQSNNQKLDPEGVLRKAGIRIFFLAGLNARILERGLTSRDEELITDLVTHPGRTRGHLYADASLYPILLSQTPEWLAAWASHELAHVQNPAASEIYIQAIAPLPELPNQPVKTEKIGVQIMTGQDSEVWYGLIANWVSQNRNGQMPPSITLEGNYRNNQALLDRLRLPIRNFSRIVLTPTWDPALGYVIEMSGDAKMSNPNRRYLIAIGDGQWLQPITEGRLGSVQGTLGHLLESKGPVELNRLDKEYATYYGGDAKVRQFELAELPSTGYRIRITLPSTVAPEKIRWKMDGPSFAGPIKRVFIYDAATRALLATIEVDLSASPNPKITTSAAVAGAPKGLSDARRSERIAEDKKNGALLRHWREKLELTQEQLGQRLGLRESRPGEAVSMFELGLTRISQEVMDTVASWVEELIPGYTSKRHRNLSQPMTNRQRRIRITTDRRTRTPNVRTTNIRTAGYRALPDQLSEGQVLREVRTALELSQTEMAKRLGLKNPSADSTSAKVSKWETGKKRIPDQVWKKIVALGQGHAIQKNGQPLNGDQNAKVNNAIASAFQDGTAKLLLKEEISAIDPDGVLAAAGVDVYLIPALAGVDSYLVAHPGTGGEAMNHSAKRIYLSPSRIETLRRLSDVAKRQFASHELGHVIAPNATEDEIQDRFPIDRVLDEVEKLDKQDLFHGANQEGAPAENRRTILREHLASRVPELKLSDVPDDFLDALTFGGVWINREWLSKAVRNTGNVQIPLGTHDRICKSVQELWPKLWPIEAPVVSPSSPDYKDFALQQIKAALQKDEPIEINHPKFGSGTVLSLSQTKAEIRFADPIGTKKLDLAIAPFTIQTGNLTGDQRRQKEAELESWVRAMREKLERQWQLASRIQDPQRITRWRANLTSDVFDHVAFRLLRLWDKHSFDPEDPTDVSQFQAIADRFAAVAAKDSTSLWKTEQEEDTTLQQDINRIEKSQIAEFKKRYEDAATNLGNDFIVRQWRALSEFDSEHSHIAGEAGGLWRESDTESEIIFTNVLNSVPPTQLENDLAGFLKAMHKLLRDYRANYSFGGDSEEMDSVDRYAAWLINTFSPDQIARYYVRINNLMEKFTGANEEIPSNGILALSEILDHAHVQAYDLGLFLSVVDELADVVGLSMDEIGALTTVIMEQPEVDRSSMLMRIHALKVGGLLPLPNLLKSSLSIQDLQSELQAIHQGHFDVNNPVHVDLNYCELAKEIRAQRPLTSRESYPEFIKFVNEIRQGRYTVGDYSVDPDHKVQIRGLAYEAHEVRKKILSLQAQARRLGRPIIVVENLSYGAVATSPITVERQGQKYIVGTDISVWSTKVGSTESHNNEFVMRENLFSSSQMEWLIKNKPIVVVIDGSTSVADAMRTSPHIPDGFKGYRNHFIAINAISNTVSEPGHFAVDQKFIDNLAGKPEFKQLVSNYKTEASDQGEPYSFYFYYPGERALYLRAGKKVDELAPKLTNDASIQGPAVVFIESAMEDEAIPSAVRANFVQGVHRAAYFDDREHYKQFYLDYEEGYGIHLSASYILRSRAEYAELTKFLGEQEAEETRVAPSESVRDIDTVVLDLDGTLVPTDQPLSLRAVAILQNLISGGKRVVITTEDIEANVDKRIAALVQRLYAQSPDLLKGLWLATDGGTTLYRFTAPDRKSRIEHYELNSQLDIPVREKILGVLQQSLAGRFKLDERPNRSSSRRVDLRDVLNRDGFIGVLRDALVALGLTPQIYKAGRTSVKVALSHKDNAVRYLIQSNSLDPARMLIIGDSARTNQIDRKMLSEFREAVAVNVGKPSRSIGRINPLIIQTDSGIEGTLRILESLAQHGQLPMRPLLPYRQVFTEPADSPATEHSPETGDVVAVHSPFFIIPGLVTFLTGITLNSDWLSLAGMGMLFGSITLFLFARPFFYRTFLAAGLPFRHTNPHLPEQSA